MKIPGKAVPDSSNLPDGIYLFGVENFSVAESKDGYVQFHAQLRALQPKSHKGLPHFESWTIGHKDDPSADDELTWKRFPATRCKQFVTRAGVEFDGDPEDVARQLHGQKVMGRIVNTIQAKFNRDGTENPYAGNVQCQAKEWYEPGDKEAEVTEQAAPSGKRPAKSTRAAKAEEVEEEEEEEAEEPPKRPVRSKPAKAKEEIEEEEEEEEEVRPRRGSKSTPKRAADEDEEDEND